jgi:hypothetical protein
VRGICRPESEQDVDLFYLAGVVGLLVLMVGLVRGCAALERKK